MVGNIPAFGTHGALVESPHTLEVVDIAIDLPGRALAGSVRPSGRQISDHRK